MLIAYLCISKPSSMTDSMNFGPEWLRNLSSEGSTGGSGTRYQLADYRYGREEMLALFEKGLRAPHSLSSFNPLYSDQVLPPLALLPQADEERSWSGRSAPPGTIIRGRGTASLDRGGRGGRGRGSYQNYNRGYDGGGGWTGTETPNEWSPRKDYTRANSVDNWRRHRTGDEDEGWRSNNHSRIPPEKWGRSASWRDGGDGGEERPNRASWQEGMRGQLPHRRPWENEDNLPEWAVENSLEAGGTFDSSGAFHGDSDDEQREHKSSKKDVPLQKSISQQNISVKSHPNTLPSSQSAISLSKPPDDNTLNDREQEAPKKDQKLIEEKRKSPPKKIEQTSKPPEYDADPPRIHNIHHKEQSEQKQTFHNTRIYHNENNIDVNGIHSPDVNNRVDEEFERIQEDFVKKLVVDEEMPKKVDNFMLSTVVPPPNLAPPTQDNWYYQDPQGDLQGPFPSTEMAEWFRAGYFTSALLVKRLCDEAFYRLGDLVTKCGGNPFQSNIRIAPLKQEIITPVPDELLKYQLLQRQLLRQQAETMRVLSQNDTPWVMPQQRDLVSQQVLAHPQMASDIQFFQQQQQQQPQSQPVTNPLMNMINQMQQANKLPSQILGKKPSQLDPIQALVQQMGGLQTLPNSGPTNSSLPTNIPTNLQNSGLLNNFPNLPTSLNTGTVPVGFTGLNNSSLHNAGSVLSTSEVLNNNLNVGLTTGMVDGNRLPPRPNPLGAVDSLSSSSENDPLKNLLQHLQNKQQTQQLDSLWQQNQFSTTQANSQWQKTETPISMWDLPSQQVATPLTNTLPVEKPPTTQLPQQPQQTNQKTQEKERQKQVKENFEKEQKRQKEFEEKQAKKDAEEKRKEEQRRQESEKKAAEEKRKKEEDRIRKELEKAKRDAEEKRLRELEEKRRLKELRKAEEEARRKMEELKKLEDTDRVKRDMKEKEEQFRKQMEAAVHQQQERELPVKAAQRVVPWSQPSSTPELSLTDIQRAEREKRAEQLAIQQQRAQVIQQEQNVVEKQVTQLSWTKKLLDNKSIKSFAEIQQEEHERFTKQTQELRAALKEKEASIPTSLTVSATPWSGQGLTWASSNQWSNNIGGFWDDASIHTQPSKPTVLSKSSSTSAVKQGIKPSKHKLKKEEQQVMKLFTNGPVRDEFTEWCTSTLTRLHSTVDIPTFINFLRDIESALEVKDYCKEYFGDVPATQQFVTQFLEKRRMFKPKILTQTDDMSSPAPAITPSVQHNSTEFQEGKAKKPKKSKMIKVDARNLGFSVTAAPDRINVGDRDYVEN